MDNQSLQLFPLLFESQQGEHSKVLSEQMWEFFFKSKDLFSQYGIHIEILKEWDGKVFLPFEIEERNDELQKNIRTFCLERNLGVYGLVTTIFCFVGDDGIRLYFRMRKGGKSVNALGGDIYLCIGDGSNERKFMMIRRILLEFTGARCAICWVPPIKPRENNELECYTLDQYYQTNIIDGVFVHEICDQKLTE